MKCSDLTEGVGRITKQNQTADVGPNQTSIEAAKFGFDVDKDGFPPVLSKKVTGSKANILSNLGLAERFTPMEIALMEGGHSIEEDRMPGKIWQELMDGSLIPNPKNTFITKADTAYDHYKVGTNLANLKSMPTGANYDEPDVIIAPYAGKKEMKYLMKQLKRIGYDVQDAQGYKDGHFDDGPTDGNAPPQVKDQGKLGKIKLDKLRSVQKDRTFAKLLKQLGRVQEGDYAPLTIDPLGRIVNGHHRYDALRLTQAEYAKVRMLDTPLEEMLDEAWSEKYKRSINCNNPKGFSQKAHCAGRKKK